VGIDLGAFGARGDVPQDLLQARLRQGSVEQRGQLLVRRTPGGIGDGHQFMVLHRLKLRLFAIVQDGHRAQITPSRLFLDLSPPLDRPPPPSRDSPPLPARTPPVPPARRPPGGGGRSPPSPPSGSPPPRGSGAAGRGPGPGRRRAASDPPAGCGRPPRSSIPPCSAA